MRKLTNQEIAQLSAQSCLADNWSNISVSEKFSPNYIFHTRFSGSVSLGVFEKEFTLSGGLKKHSGMRHVTLHNCNVGDNVLIENVQNHISNYNIGNDVFIQHVDMIVVDQKSTFGNGTEVFVLNETGGREVMINDKLSSHFAYIMSLYRHRPELISRMQEIVRYYSDKYASDMGEIGDNVTIQNAGSIRNVRIRKNAHIEGACRLENGTLNSNEEDPIHIGYGVIAEDFIICSGSHVTDGTMLLRCFVGQACHLGHNYSASDSLFFSNCHGENGEACAIFAGPYTVTHHKSTLLIAGMFSFMNAGSGSNQSNHMYKLGPIHQGIMERGGKTTSDSYILWPAKIGAFSLVMGRHYHNSDTSSMPFSYLIESSDESVLVPGANLRSVGTIRDAQKFPKRDKRKDPHKLDQLNFNLLSPYTVQKMFTAIEVLKNLQQTCGETSDTYTYQSCKIKNSSLKKGLAIYDMAIQKFLGNSIISRLENADFSTDEEMRKVLVPDTPFGTGNWRDIAGLLAPRSEIDKLINDIESGKIHKLKEINQILEDLHHNYYSLEWTWAWEKIQSYYNLSPEKITATDVVKIVDQWKEAVIGMDHFLYEDARKEFSLSSQTGFGADGNSKEQQLDFEQVRGAFEKNSFVQAVLEHIEKKTKLAEKMISRLKAIS